MVAEAVYEESREESFVRAVIARPTRLTYLFIGINLAMFVLTWLAGGMSITGANHFALVAFGAKDNLLIANEGHYWRLVTSIFLHIGFLHLFFNNYALWIIGQEMEKLYGAARFTALYLFTGIAGSVASYLYTDATSAGASGAIFGLFGALATFAFRRQSDIPDFIRKSIFRRVFPLIAINLVLSFSVKGIDKAAHLGGFVAGIALALLIPHQRVEEKQTPRAWLAIMVACFAVVFVSFVAAFTNYNGPPLQLKNLTASPTAWLRDIERIEHAHQEIVDAHNAFAEALNNREKNADIKTILAGVERGLDGLKDARGSNEKSQRFRERLTALLEEQKKILEEFHNRDEKDWKKTEADFKRFRRHYDDFKSDYDAWIEELTGRRND
jgi:rhomboid protease GluP